MRESLVLVPGIDGTGLTFHKQVPLLERRFAVTTTRLRDDIDRMDDLVEDLRREIDATAREPVTLLGESFGGALILSFALAYPDRVKRLVVLNSFANLDSQARLWLAYHLARIVPWKLMPIWRQISARGLHSPATTRDEVRRFQRMMNASTQQGYVSRLRILRSYDVRDRLGTIAAPVLYLAADRDHLVPSVRQAQMMGKLTPNATVRILEGHGHICLIAPNMDLSKILDEWVAAS
jgi:pimeloyl-ACP methyl ester carboxylesterase